MHPVTRMFKVHICAFETLTWPLHSLDLNRVEHVCDILDKHVPTTGTQIPTPPRLEGSTITVLMLLDHTARLQRFCRLSVTNVVPNDDWNVSRTGWSEAFSYSCWLKKELYPVWFFLCFCCWFCTYVAILQVPHYALHQCFVTILCVSIL